MFEWKKEFELGIEIIDEQHQNLLKIGNKINDVLLEHEEGYDDYDVIMELLDELRDYTAYHFETEEKIMLKCGYDDFDNHKAQHDKFIDYLDSIDLDEVDENQQEFLEELLKKLINWIFKHIMSVDFKYRDLVLESM